MIKMSEINLIMEDAFNNNMTFSFRASGNSMLPKICNNDLVTLKKNRNDYKVGDIVLYKRDLDDSYVLHRIRRINKNKTLFDAVGDHQYRIEKNIDINSIVAILVSYNRKDKNKEYHNNSKFYKFIVRIGIIRLFFKWIF